MVQDKELSPPKPKSNQANLLWMIKLVVTALILSYIYRTFRNEQNGIGDIGNVFGEIWTVPNAPVFVLMALLVPVNWALESLKWRKLTSRIIPLSFREAMRGTLTGLAVGVAVPAQLGDTLGRVAALKSDRRLEAIGAALVSNGIQFYVSVFAGACGWVYLNNQLPIPQTVRLIVNGVLFLIICLGPALVPFRKQIGAWAPSRKIFVKIKTYLNVIGRYTPAELATGTGYGLLRYLVFLTQFVLALSLFHFQVSAGQLAACVTLIFLAKTLIPAINVLGDLGLREFTALVVFAPFKLPAEQVVAATFLIWILNVLGPILVGIFLIWKYKWKKSR
ncbi:lysylphosphatidylglycerol synthase transmembrane domain-containing protein [Dyadobacter sp. BHUBP1]|uniref:lysylphosphatidylglycerol synthase transmembrane domain-containing protein n=1 Tax=Dyadobacter sp. BHUBP1 TaxID=3424178 RepID=UPI003D3579C0